MNDVTDLSAFRAKKKGAKPKSKIRIIATGNDTVEFQFTVDGIEFEGLITTHDGARRIGSMFYKAANNCRKWDAEQCPDCGVKQCGRWHDGIIIESGGVKYYVDGKTAIGAHRLRPLTGKGKLKYSRSMSPSSWGTVIGRRMVALDPC